LPRQIDVAAAKRLLLTVAVVGIGWTAGHLFNLDRLPYTSFYLFAATTLLAIGLYSSTYEISVTDVRRDLRTVLAAVTVGVLLKAVLISAAMLAVFRHPQYLVFGIAVAQIDPLSVAALQGKSRMSRRAKDILLAWASFDDPITVVLTVYISAITLTAMGADASGPGSVGGNVAALLASIPINVGFAILGLLLWWLSTRAGTGGRPAGAGLWARMVGTEEVRGARRVLAVCLLPVLAGFGVWRSLMLGVALLGLFYRPRINRLLGPLTQVAFLVAAFALGLLLVGGVRPVPGLVLGVAAFLSQMLVAALLTRGFPRHDRIHLALAQQNGITAIILALLLEPRFPGTVAVIAPAILVIGVLNIASNAAFDNRQALAAAVRRRRFRLDWRRLDWHQVQAATWHWALRIARHAPTPWVAADEQADAVVRENHRRLVLAARAAATAATGVKPPKRPDVTIATRSAR
jgi:NhaP-type Na+/H+ and K+/H+ antiporter